MLQALAHLEAAEHDHGSLERLLHLAEETSRLLAEGGPQLAAGVRLGEP